MTVPLRLPGLHVPLPATLLVFSDERRFLAPTLCGAVALADASRDASQRAGRIVHPDKLEYFLVRLVRHGIILDRSPVPDTEQHTSSSPPELVGIPLMPEPPLLRAANKSLAALRSVHKSTARGPASPVLRLRALHSCGLSVLDYIAGGVLLTANDVRPSPRITDDVHSAAFRLPTWVHGSLLRLPISSGGFVPPTWSCAPNCTSSPPTCARPGSPTSSQLQRRTIYLHSPPAQSGTRRGRAFAATFPRTGSKYSPAPSPYYERSLSTAPATSHSYAPSVSRW